MSRNNYRIFLAGILSFVFFFSFFQSSQAGFFDWFRKNDSQDAAVVASKTKQYTLSVSKSGSGVVTSDDGKINCGSDCKEIYYSGGSINLYATSAKGFAFDKWTGNACRNSIGVGISTSTETTIGQCQVSLYYNENKTITAKAHFKKISSSSSSSKSSSFKSYSSKSSISSAEATSTTATIKVVSPNGGEVWIAGTKKNISFKGNLRAIVDIYLEWSGGSLYIGESIISDKSKTSTYSWAIPTELGERSDYRVRVDYKGGQGNDLSDKTFTIKNAPNPSSSKSASSRSSKSSSLQSSASSFSQSSATSSSFNSSSKTTSTTKKITAVFTYNEEKTPDDIINTLCDNSSGNWESFYSVNPWYKKEAAKYGVDMNISVDCLKEQIKLPARYLTTDSDPKNFWCEGVYTRSPIKDASGVVDYVKNSNSSLTDRDFINIVHYVGLAESSCNFAVSKSFFIFIKKWKSFDKYLYYPDFSGNTFSITFAHEFGHILGASDKYSTQSGVDCLTNPKTGTPYDGYDIMCHRVNGGSTPLLKDLIVSDPTAEEMGWK